MTTAWYDTFGYDENPLSTEPISDEKRELIGREKEAKELLYRVRSGSMCFIQGQDGHGKTMMLRYIIDNFRGKGRIIYISAKKINKETNISDLIGDRKDMILLVDNVDYLTKKNAERIKFYYDNDQIKSAVFTGVDIAKTELTNSIRERIGKRIITLEPLTSDEALDIVKDRLKNDELLTEKIVRRVFVRSDRNLRRFLLNIDKLCQYMADEGEEKVKEEYLDTVIGKDSKISIEAEEDKTILCKQCQGKLSKIKDYWRCPNCEEYCESCGTMAVSDDMYCKGCGAEFEE